MNNNMEMKTVNTKKESRNLHILRKKIIHDMKLL